MPEGEVAALGAGEPGCRGRVVALQPLEQVGGVRHWCWRRPRSRPRRSRVVSDSLRVRCQERPLPQAGGDLEQRVQGGGAGAPRPAACCPARWTRGVGVGDLLPGDAGQPSCGADEHRPGGLALNRPDQVDQARDVPRLELGRKLPGQGAGGEVCPGQHDGQRAPDSSTGRVARRSIDEDRHSHRGQEQAVPYITPVGVNELVRRGHQVFVQSGAGLGSSITDEEYVAQGATTCPTPTPPGPRARW